MPKNSTLPEHFVYLAEIDDTIIQNMMYYTDQNFMGRPVKGYKAPRAILTKQAALALKAIQQDIKKDNYALVVYDAYRPTTAVQDFEEWSKNASDQKMKEWYYPDINKQDIFSQGYVAHQSGHSRGSTVDLTIIRCGKAVQSKPQPTERYLKDGRLILYLNDNTLDMGSHVDLMDTSSAHNSPLINQEFLDNRNYLCAKMEKYKFRRYDKEWWHYTYIDEPYTATYFGFDIC